MFYTKPQRLGATKLKEIRGKKDQKIFTFICLAVIHPLKLGKNDVRLNHLPLTLTCTNRGVSEVRRKICIWSHSKM